MQTNVNVGGFALAQIARALRAAEINLTNRAVPPQAVQKAHQRAAEWIKIAENSATYNFGSRTPVPGTPAWVTLKVAQGGFATGELLAEGPLQQHENNLLARLPASTESDRARLNAFFLSEQGMLQLHSLLHSGCYRVNVPEEGALLAVAWLLAHERTREAEQVLAEINPFFPRLRFYPCPAEGPVAVTSAVSLCTVADLQKSLQTVRTKLPIETMKSVLRHLHPLQDEFQALFLETIPAGSTLPMAIRDENKRTTSVDGALPCQVWPDGWQKRAQGVLASYDVAVHRFGAPSPKHKSLAVLEKFARKCVAGQKLTEGEVRRLRWLLGESNACRGLPGSSRLAALRQRQAHAVEMHCIEEQAQLVLSRLVQVKVKSEGLDDVHSVLRPADAADAAKFRLPANCVISRNIEQRVQRARKDDLFRLIESGLVPSAETLALLVPQVVAMTRSSSLGDEPRKQLYAQLYKAFSNRRSLLLLNLQHQVRISELPWVKALEALPTGAAAAGLHSNKPASPQAASREALVQITMAAFEAFPETILPNKLLKELNQLVTAAGLGNRIPIVEELAVDIFMHAFGKKFTSAAKQAVTHLQNTPYVAYYHIDCNAIQNLRNEQAFYETCCQRANHTPNARYGSPAQNATIVEQEQILTTHNLAALFHELGLADRIGARLRSLPRKCLKFILAQLASLHNMPWRTQLQTIKNSAYAWRQLVFFVSELPSDERQAFFSDAQQQVECMKNHDCASASDRC